MEILHECCCGLDVHKGTVVACLLRGGGRQGRKEVRTFGTRTADLLGRFVPTARAARLWRSVVGVPRLRLFAGLDGF